MRDVLVLALRTGVRNLVNVSASRSTQFANAPEARQTEFFSTEALVGLIVFADDTGFAPAHVWSPATIMRIGLASSMRLKR